MKLRKSKMKTKCFVSSKEEGEREGRENKSKMVKGVKKERERGKNAEFCLW